MTRRRPPLARLTLLLLGALWQGPTGCGQSAASTSAAIGQGDPAAADASAAADSIGAAVDVGASTDSVRASGIDGADSARPTRPPRPVPPPTVVPAVARIVAIGDLHGDIAATRKVLKIAGAIDDQDVWIGGSLVIVQLGDQLDRGDDEKAILLLLDSVAKQAHVAGGALYALIGNHETMNAAQQFGYVTPGGWLDFADVPHLPADDLLAQYPFGQRGRVSALRPGGPYAGLIAGHNTIQVVGPNVFVHGGVLPKHVAHGIDKINAEISAWLKNEAPQPQSSSGADSPVWDRHYSADVDEADCKLAAETLAALDAKRIVVGHTVQYGGIDSVCDGLVWRVDVGLAKHYGGTAQVLVIDGDSVAIAK